MRDDLLEEKFVHTDTSAQSRAAREEQELSGEHTRRERFRDHFNWATILMMWLVAGLWSLAALILFVSYALPESVFTITDQVKLVYLRVFALGGVLAPVANKIREYIGGPKE